MYRVSYCVVPMICIILQIDQDPKRSLPWKISNMFCVYTNDIWYTGVVCCSLLQSVAVCCSLLQCVAVWSLMCFVFTTTTSDTHMKSLWSHELHMESPWSHELFLYVISDVFFVYNNDIWYTNTRTYTHTYTHTRAHTHAHADCRHMLQCVAKCEWVVSLYEDTAYRKSSWLHGDSMWSSWLHIIWRYCVCCCQNMSFCVYCCDLRALSRLLLFYRALL